jgi:hypothetical protein
MLRKRYRYTLAKLAPTVRVVMAKSVASRWIKGLSRTEYRFNIFGFDSTAKAKKFASSLRSLRDRPNHRKSSETPTLLPSISDLGVRERGDMVEVWSSNVDSLRKLARWAESVGLNTDFIW